MKINIQVQSRFYHNKNRHSSSVKIGKGKSSLFLDKCSILSLVYIDILFDFIPIS